MIDLTVARDGTLTTVTAICPGEAIAAQVRAMFRAATNSYTELPGLVVAVRCNRREAAAIKESVERLSYRTAPVAPLASQPAGEDQSGRHRELIQATDVSERTTPKAVFVKGRRFVLTGFGKEFIGSEIHGHLWGERVRYAYYAA